MKPSSRLILTPEGPIEALRWHTGADATAGTVLLLHGIQGTAAVWETVAAALGPSRLVVAPNMWGRGRSASPRGREPYTLESFAGLVRTVFATCPKPVTLVGWSMGTLVALTYLERFGEDGIEGLVLASGTPCVRDEAIWFRGETTHEIESEAEARAKRLGLKAFATPAAVAGAWLSVKAADLRPMLRGITLPTLVMHGEKDEECPVAHGREFAEGIAGAVFEGWPGHGHNIMAEDARRFAETVRRSKSLHQADGLSANQ